ncbi:MAG: hypothetical protein R2825_14600 [Saprospiraceae bacterium]
MFDVSLFVSKGLGARSVRCASIGTADLIRKAGVSKVMGGGMRQAGYLAAALCS